MRLNDELYIAFLQSLAQLVEFIGREDYSEMRDGHIMLVDVIAMLLRKETFLYEADSQQMIIEIVTNSGICAVYFLGLDDFVVEATGYLEGMCRNSYLELAHTHLQSQLTIFIIHPGPDIPSIKLAEYSPLNILKDADDSAPFEALLTGFLRLRGYFSSGFIDHLQSNQMRPNPQQRGMNPHNIEFDKISDLPSKYPRELLPENLEENMELGGTYQNFIFSLGNCCGNLRLCLPCLCCVEYPYKQIDQSFVGIYERFGRYVKTMGSGLQYFNPFTDKIHIVDMKTNIINLNRQKALTRDNIEVDIDAAVYYNVKIPRRTYYSVSDIHKSVQELTFATLRAICGHYVLQELLQKRDEVSLELGKFVARQVHEWGIEITNILIKDIILNQELQDILAAVAKEKRLAESKILNATAEVQSAKLMRQTADILSGKAAMQIRYLEAMQAMASSGNVKVVFLAEEN